MDRSFAASMVSVSTRVSLFTTPLLIRLFSVSGLPFARTRLRAGVVAFSAGREWGADKRGCVAKKRRTAKSVDSFAPPRRLGQKNKTTRNK